MQNITNSVNTLVVGIFLIQGLLVGYIGMTLWKSKGGDPSGAFVLGAILGILGVIILAIARPGQRERSRAARSQGLIRCPSCAELIEPEARVCRHCGRDVAAAPGGVT
jgi:hypothetical protein